MTLAARRRSRLCFPIRERFLGKPDRQTSAIAKRHIIVSVIGYPVFLTGNMLTAFAMKFERHNSSPRANGKHLTRHSFSNYSQ